MKRFLGTLVLTLGLSASVLPLTPAHAASSIQFGRIQYNAPGTDTTANRSVNGEYVVIKNLSSRAVALTGWTVRDYQHHVYKFGSYALPAYKSLVLHTGKGTNSSLVRYWGQGYHVWNNTGDRAYLRNAAGTQADYCTWTSNGPGYKIC